MHGARVTLRRVGPYCKAVLRTVLDTTTTHSGWMVPASAKEA